MSPKNQHNSPYKKLWKLGKKLKESESHLPVKQRKYHLLQNHFVGWLSKVSPDLTIDDYEKIYGKLKLK